MPAMTKEQLEHFEHFGFVTAENVLDPETVIDPVIDEYAGCWRLADELYEDGKISSRYEDLEFGERVTQIYSPNQGRSITVTSTFRYPKAALSRTRRSGQGRRSSML